MGQTSRTFRIFVSSTFSDLKSERNALAEKVFPRLRELAMAHGCRFQAIDLRWGVSEEAALDQQTMKICLGEIERCQKTTPRPNFIILLGNRYGWRPLPFDIPADEFEKIIPLIAGEEKSLLAQWYRRDDNAIPPVYLLQPRGNEFVEYENWEKIETKLRQVFLTAVGRLSLSPDALLKYTASATEQEIVAGALKVLDASEHVFCFLRDIQGLPSDASAAAFCETDPQAARQQSELKTRLRQSLTGNVHEYSARWQSNGPSQEHLDQLCEDVYAELSKVILSEVGLLETVDPLEKEISAHEIFGKERARVFRGRPDILKAVEKYIAGSDQHVLAVWGASGSGKSALMAKAIEQAREKGKDVVYRFIGATPESSNGRALLESLCEQISHRYGADESTIPAEYRDLAPEFSKRLALAKPDKPLVIFLDALDQLSDTDNARNLNWLPGELPLNVHLIVSTLPGECLKALESKLPTENWLEVQPLSVEEGQVILDTWFEEVHRTLQKNQENFLLSKFKDCGLPLYLKLAFEEAKLWKSYDSMPELSGDIPGILQDLFERLSRASNHGSQMVSRSLGYLAAARNGLSEDEILDVLSSDKEMLIDFQRRSPKSPHSDRLPVVIWSRLYFDLEPYLTERSADGTSLLAFYHRQMSEACQVAYREQAHHAGLAAYFNHQPLYLEKEEEAPNLRKLSELPWQFAHGGLSGSLADLLSDYRFLTIVIAELDIHALLDDFNLLRTPELVIPADDQEALELILGVLNLDYSIFVMKGGFRLASQLHTRLLGNQNPRILQVLQQAVEEETGAWLHPLSACGQAPDRSRERIYFTGMENIVWLGITPDGKRLAACGRDFQEKGARKPWTDDLKIWEIASGKEEVSLALYAQSLGGNYAETFFLYTPDNRKLVWNFQDTENHYKNSLACLDIPTGSLSHSEFPFSPQNMLVTPDGKYLLVHSVGSNDARIMLWDLYEKKIVRTMTGDAAKVGHLRLIPGTTHCVAISTANVVTLWDYTTGRSELIYTIQGDLERITVFPDGSRLLVSRKQGGIQLLDIRTGQEQLLLKDSYENVTDSSAPTFSPDGKYLYCKGQIFSMQGQLVQKLDDWNGTDRHCFLTNPIFTPDSKEFIYSTVSGEKIFKINLQSGKKEFESGKYSHILVTPDYKKWITCNGSQISIRDFGDSGINADKIIAPSSTILDHTILGERILAVVQSDGKGLGMVLWDLKTAQKQTIPFPRSGSLFPNRYPQNRNGFLMAVQPEDHLALLHYNNIDLVAWDYKNKKTIWTYLDDKLAGYRRLTTWIISPNSQWLVGADKDHSKENANGRIIYLWDFGTGRLLRTLKLFPDSKETVTLAVSPDSKQLACAAENDIFLVDLASGNIHRQLKGHEKKVLDLRYSPDGVSLISTSLGEKVCIWDLQGSGKYPLPGCVDLGLAVSPDGKLLAYVTSTREIALFDMIGKVLLYSIPVGIFLPMNSEMGVHGLNFTNDGKYLFVCSNAGKAISLWDVQSNALVASLYSDQAKLRGARIMADETIKMMMGTGDLLTLVPENVRCSSPIVTAWQKKKNVFTKTIAIQCPHCVQWSEVPNRSAGKETACPQCSRPVRLNPFFIDADWQRP